MDYELIYDASKQLFSGGWLTLGLILGIILFVGILSFVKNNLPNWLSYLSMYLEFCKAFLVLLILLLILGFFLTFKKTYSASKLNSCKVVAGVVEDFKTTSFKTSLNVVQGVEKFKVDGVAFKYSTNDISGGFNKIAPNGGPIYRGLKVRICFIQGDRPNKNLIVRLEVESN